MGEFSNYFITICLFDRNGYLHYYLCNKMYISQEELDKVIEALREALRDMKDTDEKKEFIEGFLKIIEDGK